MKVPSLLLALLVSSTQNQASAAESLICGLSVNSDKIVPAERGEKLVVILKRVLNEGSTPTLCKIGNDTFLITKYRDTSGAETVHGMVFSNF